MTEKTLNALTYDQKNSAIQYRRPNRILTYKVKKTLNNLTRFYRKVCHPAYKCGRMLMNKKKPASIKR